MPITQIPFQDPVAPPEKPQPEQLGLYDAQGWETAYKDLDDDARVPHLLIQLQDDLARSRRREAIYISIIVHATIILLLYFGKYLPHPVVARNPTSGKDLTFLELPPDLQKLQPKPNTNIASDKNRTAMTRHPQLDVKELRKILQTPPPGAPGSSAPQIAQPPPAQSQGIPQSQPAPQPQQQTQQIAQLPPTAKPNIENEFKKYANPLSAGSAIDQAARDTVAGRGNSQQIGNGGDPYGLGQGAHGRQMGNLEVLSDTMGVDFGPYLQRVLHDVRQNWYTAIPESAEMKHGNVIIEFAIMKDGSIAGMKLVATSGDSPLDRAAWSGIKWSNPFPPLPSEFGGQYLALRFRFFYNPTKEELE